ncbi:MAG TPA: hypothetical protein VIO33_24605 [Burkholderiaceae bacterium]
MLAGCGGGGSSGDSGSEGRLQVISFNYPGGATLLSGSVTLKATATSGLPVSFRSGTPTTCTVSGDQLTLTAAGECLVIASQAGGTGADGVQWASADDTSQLFNVLKHTQAITFEPPPYVVLGGSSKVVQLSGTADSNLPLTFATATPDVCTVSGSTLTLLAKGSCAVTATQAGTSEYAMTTVQRFVAVDPLLFATGWATDGGSTADGGGIGSWAGASVDGWWCSDSNWCKRLGSADGSSFTWSYHIQPMDPKHPSGWKDGDGIGAYYGFEVFVPGKSGFDGSADTTGGLQVTTERAMVFTLGMNKELFAAGGGNGVTIDLVLGHFNRKADGNGCNVTVSITGTLGAAAATSYAFSLANMAVTDNCELAGLPKVKDLKAPTKEENDAALAQILAYNIVKMRFGMGTTNTSVKSPAGTSATDPTYATDVTLYGPITIQ